MLLRGLVMDYGGVMTDGPRMADVVRRARAAGVRTALVTDAHTVPDACAALFDLVVLGPALGVRKPGPVAPERALVAERLALRPELAGVPPYDLGRAADAMLETDAEWRLLASGDQREIARLRGAMAGLGDQPIVEVPYLDHDVHHVNGLTELGRYLIAG